MIKSDNTLKNEYLDLVKRISEKEKNIYPENSTMAQRILLDAGVKIYENANLNGERNKILENYAKTYAQHYVP
ncbi:hypothetical protein K9L67_02255 [Candidatus Woesearchaeota archaeon]|nr:hypothetical protein [Candidatus Woesearchaeota archaeon]MCF7901027.1 hypothetical protein [Candidatus Woesearchaeota archaeon]MCF8013392.1 hypothetical protein [Candidatus Woesearchaeota archaeon]